MTRTTWMKAVMAAGMPFHARKQPRIRHNLINLGSFALLLALGAALMAVGPSLPALVYIPVASVLFGAFYFGAFVLVIHECSHDMFVLADKPEQTHRLNHWIGRFAAVPFMTEYVTHWEKGHLTHHLRPCEPDDPQDGDPLHGARLYKVLAVLSLVPLSFVAYNPSSRYPGRLLRTVLGLLFWAPIWYIAWTLSPAVLVSLVLGFQVLSMCNSLKKTQEHSNGLNTEPDPLLRSRTYFYPLSPLLSPFNINYHFEHHANFNVPWYLLPAYNKALLSVVPADLQPYYFHHEYLDQMAGRKPLPPRELLMERESAIPAAR